ncbi:MAG TPA: DUF3606 domain-containing protein [Casimicrobiaceae bacterium]|nr:DUF3606 domain-containing protein [Casimicrobiaceae bacterium]
MNPSPYSAYPEFDPTVVNIDDPFEVRRWCQRFICTEAQLRAAVLSVGPQPDRVRAYFEGSQSVALRA